MSRPGLDPQELRERFRHPATPTIGLEEEVLLVDARTLDLAPRASEVLDRLARDERFKLELPAAQLELVCAPGRSIAELGVALADARDRLSAALSPDLLAVGSGAHPFAPARGELNTGGRYDHIASSYGTVATRQLVCGMHVHVAVGGPDQALAVHDALREHLPDLAALAANAPFHEGNDTGLASVRPGICSLLPRQGVPPALGSWERYAAELGWGARSGVLGTTREWWWELRLHPELGTVEIRVPDTQARREDAVAVAAVAAALVLWLGARHRAGDLPEPASDWRIAENRFSAARHGVHGAMVDVRTGEVVDTRERLSRLLDELEPSAATIGGADALLHARGLLGRGGADRQRSSGGARAATRWLTGAYRDASVS